MKRAFSTILSILVGALVTGSVLAFFLTQANSDRARLADLATKAQTDVQAAQETSKKTVDEANSKLEAANAEVAKAQSLVKAVQEERTLLATAVLIPTPSAKSIKGWNEAVSVPLKTSLKYPAAYYIGTNDATALTFVTEPATTSTEVGPDTRWFSLTPYDEQLEKEILASMSTTTPASYVINGRLATGARGMLAGTQEELLVLRIRENGLNTHLLWMRDPKGKTDEQTTLTVLGTMRFATE